MTRQIIEIESFGNIRLRSDGQVHMYMIAKDSEEITHEIVLSPKATKYFMDEFLKNVHKMGPEIIVD